MALRFLQLGDLHLGAAMSGLPTDIAAALREATRTIVAEVFASVPERNIDLVILPGDLYDSGGSDPEGQLRFVYQLCERIDPVPVVIAPGNHDAYGPQSPYARIETPRNVALFTSPDFEARETRIGTVVGRAFQEGETFSGLDWSTLPPPPPSGLLVMHASVIEAMDERRHARTVAPVTISGLEECGYNYIALGHYHSNQDFRRRGSGRVFAAYSGCPQGQGWDESGVKGCYEGFIDQHGIELAFLPLAKHQWQRRNLKLPADYSSDSAEKLNELASEIRSQIGPSDLLALRVQGRWPQARRESVDRVLRDIASSAWYARDLDLSGVEFMPELIDRHQSPVVDEFLARCDANIHLAEEDREAWELARYLGHRLLSGHGLPEEVAL